MNIVRHLRFKGMELVDAAKAYEHEPKDAQEDILRFKMKEMEQAIETVQSSSEKPLTDVRHVE